MPRRKNKCRGPSRPITSILMPDLKNPLTLSHVGRQVEVEVGIPGGMGRAA